VTPELPLTPLCPLCSTPPVIVLDGGRQSFCGSEGCPTLAWDQYVALDELLANAHPAVVTTDEGVGRGE
jgi:hypothetical protein